ncbi:cyclic pyranopterin monophosphate synthase MoaC [soil metagenome]
MKAKKLTHLDERGRVHMVDVAAKPKTEREATAEAIVKMAPATLARLREGTVAKGDALAVVRIAAIQAAKRTPELIPLCHTIALTQVDVDVELRARDVRIRTTARAFDRTGVEMEALVAASTGALALYDMLKAVDRSISFSVELSSKRGGNSGDYRRKERG